ncbi:hypothetical protein [Streptomyces sp. NPDC002913]
MSKTTTRAAWPTLTVAELATQAPAATPDADLIQSVTEDGITDPIYIADTDSGPRIVDGARRFAAAVAAGLTDVPVTYRPLIAVEALAQHPANIRRDLKITKAFRASIQADGISVSIKVTRDGAGLRIIDGHRRYAAAVAEGMTHVPYQYDERDEAGQMLDMVTTAVHRESITPAEEAAALFAADQLGADTKRLAAASGRTQKEAKAMVRAGGSAMVATVAATASRELDLEDMISLAELEARSTDAAERVRQAVADRATIDVRWTIRVETSRLNREEEAAGHRAELEKAGASIRPHGELADTAAPVFNLRGVADHGTCPGDVWVHEDPTDSRYVRYCASPALYGHTVTASTGQKPSKSERRAIITGGVHWDAAQAMRQEWLAQILGRKSHPKALADQFLTIAARAMLGGDYVLTSRMNSDKADAALKTFLGAKDTNRRTLAAQADSTRRNPAHLFAVIAAAYEAYMPRTTWRTDGDHHRSEVRKPAAQYLEWLAALGYEPSPIEAAVMAGETYDPAAAAIEADANAAQA